MNVTKKLKNFYKSIDIKMKLIKVNSRDNSASNEYKIINILCKDWARFCTIEKSCEVKFFWSFEETHKINTPPFDPSKWLSRTVSYENAILIFEKVKTNEIEQFFHFVRTTSCIFEMDDVNRLGIAYTEELEHRDDLNFSYNFCVCEVYFSLLVSSRTGNVAYVSCEDFRTQLNFFLKFLSFFCVHIKSFAIRMLDTSLK